MMIPFVKPYLTGKEIEYLNQVRHFAGDGPFTKQCQLWIENQTTCSKALLTQSCTAALEMSALLLDIQPGDEIIMPSFTFVSTANAFVLRGGVPVFVDIRPDTLNLDENLIESAITSRTKAIVVMHYAGVGCEMDTILKLAKKYQLAVVEDAAQGILATYKNKALGTFGALGTFSFHETKNIIAGEGGALLINDPRFIELSEIIREKGTDRSRFFRGQVDKYTWQHLGSSFLPSELTAAFLLAQFEAAEKITQKRLAIWNAYHQAFAELEEQSIIRRPMIPHDCQHNAHIYYLLINHTDTRTQLANDLKKQGIHATFHYVPLHSSPAGQRYGRIASNLIFTEDLPYRLIRLPLFTEMDEGMIEKVVTEIKKILISQLVPI